MMILYKLLYNLTRKNYFHLNCGGHVLTDISSLRLYQFTAFLEFIYIHYKNHFVYHFGTFKLQKEYGRLTFH